MARYEAKFPLLSGWRETSGRPLNYVKSMVLDIRDRIRTGLSGSSAVVSDICQWEGNSSGSNQGYGYSFLIKDGIDEWWIVFSRSYTSPYIRDIITLPDNEYRNYFRTHTDSNPTSTTLAEFLVIYNCRKGSFAMGFDDLDACTYVAGDFADPAISPYVDGKAFLPEGMLPAWIGLEAPANSSDLYARNCQIIYCDTHKALSLMISYYQHPFPEFLYMSGQMAVPVNDLDTSKEYQGVHRLNWTASSSGTIGNNQALYAYGNGHPISLSVTGTVAFTPDNYILPDGTIAYFPVKIYHNNFVKGFIHTDLMRAMGPYNSPMAYGNVYQTPTGPVVKTTSVYAVMFKEGAGLLNSDLFFDARYFTQ